MLSTEKIYNAVIELVEIEDAIERAQNSYDDDTEDRLIILEANIDGLANRLDYGDCELVEKLAKDFKNMRAQGYERDYLENYFMVMIDSFIEFENSLFE